MDKFEDCTEAEAYQHLAFSHTRKPRLKNALNLDTLMQDRAASFEVEDATADLTLHDDDDDLAGLDVDTYAASLFTKNALTKFKNANTVQILADMDIMTVAFSELEESMISIHDNGLVKKEIVKPGTGKKVPENGKLFVHYLGICEGSDEPFDSSVLRKSPAIFDMRNADMIPGFFLALLSMEVKEVSKFMVKSPMAFGSTGCPPRIPPEADVFFVVEVLQSIEEDLLKSPLYMTAEERAKLPFKELFAVAEQLQTDGNGHYRDGSLWPAVKKYRKGVTLLEDYPVIGGQDEGERCKLLHTLYANLAQCYLSLERPEKACTACKLGMRHAKGKASVKLLFRFAKAQFQLKDCARALKICNDALKLDPQNRDVLTLKAQIQCEDNKQSVTCKQMYREMFKN
jgi:FKBP-type peptidyl-prolyl cis-trans isomerase